MLTNVNSNAFYKGSQLNLQIVMTTKMSTFGIQQNFVPIKINDSTAVKTWYDMSDLPKSSAKISV